MKLQDIPVAVCTLPVVDYRAAKQAQYHLGLKGVVTTIWKIGDEWVLESDDYRWVGQRYMMVKICSAAYIFEALEIEPLPGSTF